MKLNNDVFITGASQLQRIYVMHVTNCITVVILQVHHLLQRMYVIHITNCITVVILQVHQLLQRMYVMQTS